MAVSVRSSKQIRTMRDLLQETEVNLLECKVCFEKFSEAQRPRNLPCGHIICQECVCALAQPRNPSLECPFCRRPCRASETSDCLPVLHLIEILSNVVTPDPSASAACVAAAGGHVTPLPPAGCTLSLAFGGWGKLINPTGVAVCPESGCVVVAHDGKKRINIFSSAGDCIQQFGVKGEFRSDIKYPLGVAITLDGYIVVTDAGDRSVKVFDFNGRSKLVIKDPFRLPWGVAVSPQNEVIVTDSEAGALFLLTVDFKKGKLQKSLQIFSNLCHPQGVAVCQASGAVIVVEHLNALRRNDTSTRLKVFNRAMKLVGQVDSFGFSLLLPSELHATAVAFDRQANIVVADAYNRVVLCLGKLDEFPSFQAIVTHGLSYPVALTCAADNSLIVLDSGDHSVKVYSSN